MSTEVNSPCTGRSIYFNVSEHQSNNLSFQQDSMTDVSVNLRPPCGTNRFLLLYGRHVVVPLRGTNMISPYKAL